ncbi:hypothetical protein B0T21DRAFT_80849 [Apiosordaria backusii]|uniref:Secreted protein n=1 Tax=Apiosordaria backusii TaxID=314023 RepID=A0AA40A3U8_9PEZI|nr:hypothetical protein B0T21DRAFT_80849 [Apiosordaria backusii]
MAVTGLDLISLLLPRLCSSGRLVHFQDLYTTVTSPIGSISVNLCRRQRNVCLRGHHMIYGELCVVRGEYVRRMVPIGNGVNATGKTSYDPAKHLSFSVVQRSMLGEETESRGPLAVFRPAYF